MLETAPLFLSDAAAPAFVDVGVVGAKSAGLARLARLGERVPAIAALPVAFFAPWFDALAAHPAWAAIGGAPTDAWSEASRTLQEALRELPLSAQQAAALDACRHWALEHGAVAVRSSSPEEDTAAAAFAGVYETHLNVAPSALEDAVRACAASAIDVRVLRYKHDAGMDPTRPRLAVTVQAQLQPRAAGVLFTVNPATNDYDELAIDAAAGLGDQVVDGTVRADHVVVDKHTGAIVTQRTGGEPVLGREDIDALRAAAVRVEAEWGGPTDIEWAIDQNGLALLQARPITRWVPIDASLRTAPDAPRRLYMDIGLAGGMTTGQAISPIGSDWMSAFLGSLVGAYLGDVRVDGLTDRLWLFAGGRMYQDMSLVLRYSSAKKLAKAQSARDATLAETLEAVDRERYRARERPAWMRLSSLAALARLGWRLRRAMWGALAALLAPDRARARLERDREAFHAALAAAPSDDVAALRGAWEERVIRHVIDRTMPALGVGIGMGSVVDWVVPKRWKAEAQALLRGHTENVVAQMNDALYTLGGVAHPHAGRGPDALGEALLTGNAPSELQEAWDAFRAHYGWRGPSEVDLGSPRYRDAPALALRQALAMFDGGAGVRPSDAFARTEATRAEALATLRDALGPLRRSLLNVLVRRIDALAPTRDHPKHDYLHYFARVRDALRVQARARVTAGDLDHESDFAFLTMDALADPSAPVRDMASSARAERAALEAVVPNFPSVIDSRGRILRPERRDAGDGALHGTGVSPGVAVGPVVRLTEPDPAKVPPGAILVAYVTDPGWTPLFANAAAIVLEIGGVLQHGAVVAREYGKPCVVGVVGVMETLKEGAWVEVDGDAGWIRPAKQSE